MTAEFPGSGGFVDGLHARRRCPFVIRRHHCDADPWYFAEIPALLDGAREKLALREDTELRRALLGRPLGRLVAELHRPCYWLHEGEIQSSAHAHGDDVVLIHRLKARVPADETCGVVLEFVSGFATPGGPFAPESPR